MTAVNTLSPEVVAFGVFASETLRRALIAVSRLTFSADIEDPDAVQLLQTVEVGLDEKTIRKYEYKARLRMVELATRVPAVKLPDGVVHFPSDAAGYLARLGDFIDDLVQGLKRVSRGDHAGFKPHDVTVHQCGVTLTNGFLGFYAYYTATPVPTTIDGDYP